MHTDTAIADHGNAHAVAVTGCPRCRLDAGDGSEALACRKCETVGAGRYCSACGAELERGHALRRAMRALFEPFFEYFQHIRWLIHPGDLAHEVRGGHVDMAELIGFWVAAILVAGLFQWTLPALGGEKIELPILLEAAQALVRIAMISVLFAPAHLLLRIAHRDVSVRQYLMTTLTVSALLYPWLQAVQTLIALYVPGRPTWLTLPFSLTFYGMAYAALYRRRFWTALPIIAGYVLAVAALYVGVVLAIQASRNAPPARQAATVRQ